jgi:hypothetical protein
MLAVAESINPVAKRDIPVTIVRVGTNQKYADGWETAFGKGKREVAISDARTAKASSKKTATKSPKKKAAKGKKK